MKKITALFFLFFFCILLYGKKEVTDFVFEEIGYTDESTYCYLTFPKGKLYTKDFEKYFANQTVISIKPYIKEIYKQKMQSIETYTFTPDSYTNNIILFESLYKNRLKDNGILSDIAKIEIYGIPIQEVKLLCNHQNFSYLNPLNYKIKVRNI